MATKRQTPIEKAHAGMKRRPHGEIATRQNSIDWAGVVGYLPNPDPVLFKLGRDMTAYEDIIADPTLNATISQRKSGVKSKLWEIDRGKSKSRQAKVIQECFDSLDIAKIEEDILDYFLTGYSPIEVVWDKPGKNGLIMPKKVEGKPPEWFTFSPDNELRFRSRTNFLYGDPIPPYSILLPRYNPTYKNPYGQSLLSVCFWPITFKTGSLKFWMKFVEKYASPFAIGKLPRSAGEAEYTKLADILDKLVQDACAAIPDDASIDFLTDSQKSASADIYKGMCDFANAEIAKAILGQTLTTEQGDRGTQALGTVHQGVAQHIVEEDTRTVENTFNQLIQWIMQINFGNAEAPKFCLYQEQDVDKTRAERDKLLADTKMVQFSQQYIDSAYGFQKGDVTVTEPKEEPVPMPFSEFAEGTPQGQAAVDNLIESFTPEQLEKQADFVKPIVKLFRESNDFDEAMKGLIKIFPDVHPTKLQRQLRNAIFVTEAFGRLEGETA